MKKAIFLDRDGTIVEDEGYVHKVEDFKLLPNVIDGLSLLKKDFIFIVISNQSGIGRGYFTSEHVDKFNEHMICELKKKGIEIKKVYYCPHHPKEDCECRKPGLKFIKQAKKEFEIDLEESYVIGDHEFDVVLGKNFGGKGVLVLTGHGEKHFPSMKTNPDYVAKNLLDAAKWILKDSRKSNLS